MQKELDNYKGEIEMKQCENGAMKEQISKINKELANAKKDIQHYKYSDRFFQVERLKDGLMKTKKPMIMIFRLNQENNKKSPKVEVVINRSRHGVIRTDNVDIVGIKLTTNAKKKDQFDISFNVSQFY